VLAIYLCTIDLDAEELEKMYERELNSVLDIGF